MSESYIVYDALDLMTRLDLVNELVGICDELEKGEVEDFEKHIAYTDRVVEIVEILTNDSIEESAIAERNSELETNETDVTPTPFDPEWEREKNELQKVIEQKHPMMADPKLKDVILPIYQRNKDNADHVSVIEGAVQSWADYAVELTKNL